VIGFITPAENQWPGKIKQQQHHLACCGTVSRAVLGVRNCKKKGKGKYSQWWWRLDVCELNNNDFSGVCVSMRKKVKENKNTKKTWGRGYAIKNGDAHELLSRRSCYLSIITSGEGGGAVEESIFFFFFFSFFFGGGGVLPGLYTKQKWY
jgi:hypothetical protein